MKECLAQLKSVIELQNGHDQRNFAELVAKADATFSESDNKVILVDAVYRTHKLYTALVLFFKASLAPLYFRFTSDLISTRNMRRSQSFWWMERLYALFCFDFQICSHVWWISHTDTRSHWSLRARVIKADHTIESGWS